MAAYTMQQFIDRAKVGGGVIAYTTTTANAPIDIPIGDAYITFDTSNNSTVTSVDLGKYFTAQQVLESYELRTNILAATILVEAGVVSLSPTPVI